jgi:3-deoxy-D-manno-octulosonic-acid transferase
MYAIYNLILYLVTIIGSPFFIAVLALRTRYRAGFFQKCGLLSWGAVKKALPSRPLWVHAVSVGEVMTAIPLIKEMKRLFPGTAIILSTATETGKRVAQQNIAALDHSIFFPFDFPLLTRLFISRIQPLAFIALETELWPNFLRTLRQHNIPAVIISGRISSRSFRTYQRFLFFFRQVLKAVDCFCMQTIADAERIITMGADRQKVCVTGNLKFDVSMPVMGEQGKKLLYASLNLKEHNNIFIAGSTHRGEEEIILRVYQTLKEGLPGLTLILAPRHPERFNEVASLIQEQGLPFVRKTAVTLSAASCDVILLDTIGELATLYSIGTVIFIGGSLVPVGGHNVLEPAVFRKPILFGPHMNNFMEIARTLTAKHAAVQVRDTEGLLLTARQLFSDEGLRKTLGDNAFQVISENAGALKRSLEKISPLIKKQII